MKKSPKKKIFLIFFLTIFLSSLLVVTNYTYATPNGESLTFQTNCRMLTNSRKIGTVENVSSIDIPLSSANWNLTKINLNFTNIKMKNGIKVIEENSDGSATIGKFVGAQAIQMNISRTTLIYGIYINGRRTGGSESALFQIQGWDEDTHKPNGTVYKSIPLNLSAEEDWYLQDFSSSPITLHKGNYSLIMNGTDISGDTRYWWNFNKEDPYYPNLYSGRFKTEWATGLGRIFLHKIILKYDVMYNPQDINMSAVINDIPHIITNKFGLGGGNLSLRNLNLLQDNSINITIIHNQSINIDFNVDYSFFFQKEIIFEGIINTNIYLDNEWNVDIIFDRSGFDYYQTIFNYSDYDWQDIAIYKDEINVTSPEFLNKTNKTIIFLNTSLLEETSSWVIKAFSQKVNFNLDFPSSLLNFERGQNLQFTVYPPGTSNSNLTFILINALGYEENSETVEDISGEMVYSILIPGNAHIGAWNVYVFWNNETHTGVVVQSFNIYANPTFNPEVIINGIIIFGLCSVVGGSSIQTVRILKNRYEDKKIRLLNIFGDMFNIEYFIISEKKTGLNIYKQVLSKKKQNPLLISGYLDALSKFEFVLTNSDEYSRSIKLEYNNSKIIVSDYKSFRITLIMKQNPSKYILNSLEKLSYEIEQKYGTHFEEFDGTLGNFKDLDILIEKYLFISLVFPYRIAHFNIEKISKAEKEIVNRALNILEAAEHFYIPFIIPDNKWNYGDLKTIIKLIDDKIFFPIRKNYKFKGKTQLK